MTIEECDGNWNFMYEFRIDDSWYPCNIIEKKEVDVNRVWIFTRNGTITTESREDVRKMSEDRYLKQRQDTIKNVGKYALSQYCVELWCKNQGTIFVEPPLLAAIQERISELNF